MTGPDSTNVVELIKPTLVPFEMAAAADFQPVEIDLAALPTAEQLNNPGMISVRLAALTLARTKAELIDYVRQLGGDRDDGGELPAMLQTMHDACELFRSFVRMLEAADTRLFAAACALNPEVEG